MVITHSYQSTWPIDHDDGSSFFHDHDNVLIYGGYKNLFGHDQLIERNLYVYPDHTSPFDGAYVRSERQQKSLRHVFEFTRSTLSVFTTRQAKYRHM
jgi:hypothetical protein